MLLKSSNGLRRFGCLLSLSTQKFIGRYCVAAAIFLISANARSQIFVIDNNLGLVGEYATSGAAISPSLISGLNYSFGIAESEGNLYVTNASNGSVGKYTTTGVTVDASLITGLIAPIAVFVSGSELFVASYGPGAHGPGNVGKYTISGEPINTSLVTGLDGPFGLAVSDGNVYVINQNLGTVGKYTTSGEIVNRSLISGLQSPRGIAVYGEDLYVVSQQDGSLGKYTTSGGIVNRRIADVFDPEAIVISGGKLFVTNSAPSGVAVFTYTGQVISNSLIAGLQGAAGIDVLPHPLQIVAAASRRTQGKTGAFDIDLPLAGTESGVECREGHGSYTFVFLFNNNVIGGNAMVTNGIGIVSGVPTFSDHSMTVQLAGVVDAQTITITLSDVSDDAGQSMPAVSVRVSLLIGDVTSDRVVNSSDVAHIKTYSGSALTMFNFRDDINGDGTIDSSDVALAKLRSGAGIP